MNSDTWGLDQCVPFGQSDVRVLPLGIGTHGHGHAFGGLGQGESRDILAAVNRSVPRGGWAIVDVAPRYGHGVVESWVGELDPLDSDRLLLVTKGGRHIESGLDNVKDFSAEYLRAGLEASLGRLKRQHVFMLQMHNPTIGEITRGEFIEVLEGFRAEGLIAWYGVSIDTAAEGHRALDHVERGAAPGMIALQAIHSMLTHVGNEELFARASALSVAVIAREVLVRGLLTEASLDYETDGASAVSKLVQQYGREQLEARRRDVLTTVGHLGLPVAQAAVAYAQSTHGVTVALVGCNRRQYLSQDWVSTDQLSPDVMRELSGLPQLIPL